jgi:hypothetical protein
METNQEEAGPIDMIAPTETRFPNWPRMIAAIVFLTGTYSDLSNWADHPT